MLDKSKTGKKVAEGSRISFPRLVYEALPEIQSFQFLTKLILAALIYFVGIAAKKIVGTTSAKVVTTANLSLLFTSWQGYALILLGIFIVYIYVAMDILAQIRLCGDIISGAQIKLAVVSLVLSYLLFRKKELEF